MIIRLVPVQLSLFSRRVVTVIFFSINWLPVKENGKNAHHSFPEHKVTVKQEIFNLHVSANDKWKTSKRHI